MSTTRPKAVYFFYYAALACLVPFMTLFYQERGMNPNQIGVLAGAIPLVGWVSAPFWGGIADARQRHRTVLLLGIGGVWVAVVGLYFAQTFAQLLLAVVVYAFFIAPIVPIVDNAVMCLLEEKRNMYGRVRLWGSYGWASASLLIGPFLERAGLIWSFFGFLSLMAVNFAVTIKLPLGIIPGERPAYRAGLGILTRNGRFVLLLVTALVFGITMGVLLSYQALFLDELGASRSLIALASTVGTLSEIPFWLISARLLHRFGTARMIAMALLLTTIRNIALAAMHNPVWVLPISLLHGPSFAVLWAAGVADADAAAPAGLGATAQGLFSGMMFGLGSALGGFIGGPASAAIGYSQLFFLLSLLTAGMLGVFVAVRLRSRHVVRRRESTDSADFTD